MAISAPLDPPPPAKLRLPSPWTVVPALLVALGVAGVLWSIKYRALWDAFWSLPVEERAFRLGLAAVAVGAAAFAIRAGAQWRAQQQLSRAREIEEETHRERVLARRRRQAEAGEPVEPWNEHDMRYHAVEKLRLEIRSMRRPAVWATVSALVAVIGIPVQYFQSRTELGEAKYVAAKTRYEADSLARLGVRLRADELRLRVAAESLRRVGVDLESTNARFRQENARLDSSNAQLIAKLDELGVKQQELAAVDSALASARRLARRLEASSGGALLVEARQLSRQLATTATTLTNASASTESTVESAYRSIPTAGPGAASGVGGGRLRGYRVGLYFPRDDAALGVLADSLSGKLKSSGAGLASVRIVSTGTSFLDRLSVEAGTEIRFDPNEVREAEELRALLERLRPGLQPRMKQIHTYTGSFISVFFRSAPPTRPPGR